VQVHVDDHLLPGPARTPPVGLRTSRLLLGVGSSGVGGGSGGEQVVEVVGAGEPAEGDRTQLLVGEVVEVGGEVGVVGVQRLGVGQQ